MRTLKERIITLRTKKMQGIDAIIKADRKHRGEQFHSKIMNLHCDVEFLEILYDIRVGPMEELIKQDDHEN